MQWSAQQAAALVKVKRWLDAPVGTVPQVYRLFGFAGTGKSTLAKELNEHVSGEALACAYTGKAASVMAAKGLPGATTVHRLIYQPTGNDGKHLKELKEELRLLEEVDEPSRELAQRLEAVRRAVREAEEASKSPKFILKQESLVSSAPVVFLDECTMVDERMGQDLLSFGVKVLVLGDPMQLPPVKGTGYFIKGEPDTLLTEIHRQAADNPIIALATRVREGRDLQLGSWGDSRVVTGINAKDAMATDQMLCGTNNRRRAINARQRQLRGLDGYPMPRAGERLVCLKNNHELGLLNGTQWIVDMDVEWEPGEADFHLRIRPDVGGEVLGVPCEASLFIDEDQKPQWGSNEWFTYGDCLTVHKAQGSQWNDVIVFNDWRKDSSAYFQWLYTAVTRAAERLTVVL